jgi:hypothetical protein
MARPDIPTVAAAKLALRLALVSLDVVVSGEIAWKLPLASQLISFHYVEAAEVRLLDDLINRPELYRSTNKTANRPS